MNMKHKLLKITGVSLLALLLTGCMQTFEPQGAGFIVSKKQVADAPNAFDDLLNATTNDLVGGFPYGNNSDRANDFGLPAFFIMRDVRGQDMIPALLNWWGNFYKSTWLGPTTANAQMPWTCYYKWIKSCNLVISMAGETPTEYQKSGVGIAYAMRAYYYLEMAQLFVNAPYSKDPTAVTVPYVTEATSNVDLMKNPRLPYKEMCEKILADLDQAEKYLAGYKRTTKEMPDLSVVYGIKARTYLIMCDWANAEKYAKLAQQGYSVMTGEQYTDRNLGFNTPNDSWMLCMTIKPDDPTIRFNDADTSWGSHMILEINPDASVSQCGYASNYGQPLVIDRHLYETMPESDARKLCFVDFAINDLPSRDAQLKALEKYSDYPFHLYMTGASTWGVRKDIKTTNVGGLSLKFRAAGGKEGRDNQYIGFCVSIPMMRVEEMKLIEAEAAGMQSEGRGIALLTEFAKTRDPQYVYGTHNEAYYNPNNTAFQNEIWWQRRVEFWGEGISLFDIKRLGKGIIRSYKGTNHIDKFQWNVDHTPDWFNYCIVDTEVNYNPNENNPAPSHAEGNDAEFVF